MVRGAMEKNDAERCREGAFLVGASLAQKALNEGGLTTSWHLAARIYSLILCLRGIIVMMMIEGIICPDTQTEAFHILCIIFTIILQGSPHLHLADEETEAQDN